MTTSATSDVRPHWLFDDAPIPDPLGYGQRAIDFLAKLKHPKSTAAKHRLQVYPFQERLIRKIYGDVWPDGSRKIRTVYLRMGRGNRKTSLIAALSLLHLFGPEQVPGGRIISAAADRLQAKLTFDEVTGIIGMSPTLTNATKSTGMPHFTVRHHKSETLFQSISADGEGKHGLTPTVVITDEIHAWTHNRALWSALTSGLAKVPNTLHFITTTAGSGQDGIAWEQESYARAVATGAVDDPSYLPVILEVGSDLDWKDERNWHLANPGLQHGFPDLPGLRTMAQQAATLPMAKVDFERFVLGRWQDASLSPWLDMAIYDEGARPVDAEALIGEQCWIGVDFGLVNDLSAIVAAFPRENGEIHILAWFFCPEDGLARKAEADKAPYLLWRDQGYLTTTPGNVVDRRILAEKVTELCEDYNVGAVLHDPFKLRDWAADLMEQGLPMVEHRQGALSMIPAVDALQNTILAGRFVHGGNPVLRWNFSNVVVKVDSSGGASFHKGRSRGRIDGAIASAMAVGQAVSGESGMSIYADETQRPAGLLFV